VDDLHAEFDILHEVPELENPLREWRLRQAREAVMRDMHRRRIDILVKSMCGYEPRDDNGGGSD